MSGDRNAFCDLIYTICIGSLRYLHRKVDRWVRGLSRGTYAILSGGIAGFSVLVVSTALGDPDYIFAIVMALTLTVLYYWFYPNHIAK